MKRLISVFVAAFLALVVAATPASARPLEGPRAQGLVGDQADGYLGIVSSAGAAYAQQVAQVNAARRDQYAKVAAKQGTTVEAVGAVFGAKLWQQTRSGEYFRDANGNWVRKP